jgi:hypothetical protein
MVGCGGDCGSSDVGWCMDAIANLTGAPDFHEKEVEARSWGAPISG